MFLYAPYLSTPGQLVTFDPGIYVPPVAPVSTDPREEVDNDFFGDGPYMGTGTAFDTSEQPPVYTPAS